MVCKYCGKFHKGNNCIKSGNPARPYRCARCNEKFVKLDDVTSHMELNCDVTLT